MTHHLSEEEIQKIARERVEAKKGFFIHLIIYIIVNIFLALVWFLTSGAGSYPWFLWVLGGWGIGVVANAVAVFIGQRGGSWEAREIEKEVEKMKRG